MANNSYLGYYFQVSPVQPTVEILIAELGEAGFESFVETQDGLHAYVQKEQWHEQILEDIYILNSGEFEISYRYEEIEQVNWNKEWEKNFDPIIVDAICSVRAPFHPKPNTQYDIVIEPKMSFGTGHHETTYMMITHLLQTELDSKTVLDMGCGTGILAILAEMRGASAIDAIDIDNWCYINTIENVERNQCTAIKVYEGDVQLITDKSYDIIIANINRNVLLKDIKQYAKSLKSGGTLLLSGFYEKDLEMITAVCNEYKLEFQNSLNRNDWIAASYVV